MKKFPSWSSDSQELESFSQDSNYSDTSHSLKKYLIKFEVSSKSRKLINLQHSLAEINISLPCDSLKPLDERVRIFFVGNSILCYIFQATSKEICNHATTLVTIVTELCELLVTTASACDMKVIKR